MDITLLLIVTVPGLLLLVLGYLRPGHPAVHRHQNDGPTGYPQSVDRGGHKSIV